MNKLKNEKVPRVEIVVSRNTAADGRTRQVSLRPKPVFEMKRTLKPILPKLPKLPKLIVQPSDPSDHGSAGTFVGPGVCYICDSKLTHGFHLVKSYDDPKLTSLPAKISQLMGDSFVVVVKDDDVMCETCNNLLAYMDAMERELVKVKKIVRCSLEKKYDCISKIPSPKEANEKSGINEGLFRRIFPSIKTSAPLGSTWARKYNQSVASECSPPATSSQPAVRPLHKCTMCDREFESRKFMKDHKISAHLSSWTCHFCDEKFADQGAFTSHMKLHLSEKKVVVPTPPPPLAAVAVATRGDEVVEEETPEAPPHPGHEDQSITCVCDVCNLSFFEESDYLDHMQTHGDEFISMDLFAKPPLSGLPSADELVPNPNSDEFIQMFDNSNESLDSSNKFMCAKCEAEFPTLHDLTDHFIVAHDMPQCSQCPGIVGTKDEIDAHCLEVHGNINPQAIEANDGGAKGATNSERSDVVVGEDTTVVCDSEGGELYTGYSLQSVDEIIDEEGVAEAADDSASQCDGTEVHVLNEQLICVQCGGEAESLEILNMHKEQCDSAKANVDSLTCGICGAIAESKEVLSIHLESCAQQANGAPLSDTCDEPKQELVSDDELKHELVSDDEEELLDNPASVVARIDGVDADADPLGADMDVMDDVYVHDVEKVLMTNVSKRSRNISCYACNAVFDTKGELYDHEQSEPDHLVIGCPDCETSFPRERALNEHRAVAHEVTHCRHCRKSFTSLKTLKAHEARHLKSSNTCYECPTPKCDRVFVTPTGLRNHIVEHTGDYKVYCEYCSKGFASKARYLEHRASHTKEARYTCEICNLKFSVQATYWIHRKWHDNPKPYKCDECGRLFKHSSLLSVHKRKHTGERPYQCQYCSQSFIVSSSLKRHITLHTGIFPYNCSMCNIGFTAKHKMTVHMSKVHNDHQMLREQHQNKRRKMVMAVRSTDEDVEEVEEEEGEVAEEEAASDTVTSHQDWAVPVSSQYLTLETNDGSKILFTEDCRVTLRLSP